MRTLLAIASVALLVGAGFGCGDDTTTTTANDMAATADLTVGGDMAKIQTCAAILTCVGACTSASCQTACYTNASSAAQAKFGPFLTCLVETCGPGDGGNGSCANVTDTSAACQTCLGGVFQGAMTAGMACHAEFATCAAN